MNQVDPEYEVRLSKRHAVSRWFERACLAATLTGIVVLAVLLVAIFWQAWGWLDIQYLGSYDSRIPEKAGIFAGLWGSLWLIIFTTIFSVPIGVGAAIYLEEYATESLLTRTIRINLSNLAGVPSIVYGILGLTVFVRMFNVFGTKGKVIAFGVGAMKLEIPLPFDRSVVSGSLTLTLLILPVVIVASQEALRAVPSSIRHASLALGGTRWQTIRHQVLPASTPGILTGVILAVSRAIGETAPLVMIGALTYIAFTPGRIERVSEIVTEPQKLLAAPFDQFTALPIQIFNWVNRPKVEYEYVAAAGILVLLFVLLLMNAAAIVIRYRFQRNLRW